MNKSDEYTIDILDHKAIVKHFHNVNIASLKESDMYIVEFKNFPGLIGGGETLEEAIKEATEGLEMFLEVKNTK